MGSNPGFTMGVVPTASAWNSYFSGKQDDIASLNATQLAALSALIESGITGAQALALLNLAAPLLPVYSGSGPAPVPTGMLFNFNGFVVIAQ